MKKDKFKIASVNTFFDGADVSSMGVTDWVMLHANMFFGNPATLQKHQEKRKDLHPLEKVIKEYDPDVVVVNEIVHTPWGSESQNILHKYGFHDISYGRDPTGLGDYHRMTAVATRFPATKTKLKVQSFPGGRFCALQADGWVFIGVQGCPFYDSARLNQIKRVFKQCEKYHGEECNVLVAGDFNTDLVEENVSPPAITQHISEKTFPHSGFYDQLANGNGLLTRWTKNILGLKNGQRSLDHILVSEPHEVNGYWTEQTSSDHLALVAEVKLQ